jgi:hypothetical protein
MGGKSIDQYMVEDREYEDETTRAAEEFTRRREAAQTDEERERIRREAVAYFQGAALARYDRAKVKADQEAGR